MEHVTHWVRDPGGALSYSTFGVLVGSLDFIVRVIGVIVRLVREVTLDHCIGEIILAADWDVDYKRKNEYLDAIDEALWFFD